MFSQFFSKTLKFGFRILLLGVFFYNYFNYICSSAVNVTVVTINGPTNYKLTLAFSINHHKLHGF